MTGRVRTAAIGTGPLLAMGGAAAQAHTDAGSGAGAARLAGPSLTATTTGATTDGSAVGMEVVGRHALGNDPVQSSQRGVLTTTTQVWGVAHEAERDLAHLSDRNPGLWIVRRTR